MSTSRIEEIITALWVIAALLAFNGGHQFIGVVLSIKAATDWFAVIYFGWKEQKAEKELQQ